MSKKETVSGTNGTAGCGAWVYVDRAEGRASHQWQEEIVVELIKHLKSGVNSNNPVIQSLIGDAHADVAQSVNILGQPMPNVDNVVAGFGNALSMVNTTRVNSEKDILALLDETGQLKLRTPFNIFIGGQILDRGLTIANLIGFYYGRRPQRF